MQKIAEEIEKFRLSRDLEAIFLLAQQLKDIAEKDHNDYYMTIACYHIANYYFNCGNYQKSLLLLLRV